MTVPRSARYYTLGPTDGSAREVWIACHGYAQLAGRFIRQFAPIDDGTRLIVAPEALSRFYIDPLTQRRHQNAPRIGATWMTKEDRDAEISDYVRYLDLVSNRVHSASSHLIVLGFSQGAATVCRWVGVSPVRARHVVLWAGTIPPELDLRDWAAKLGGASVTYVAGDTDEMATPALVNNETERMAAAGVEFTMQRFSGGHYIEAEALVALSARLSS